MRELLVKLTTAPEHKAGDGFVRLTVMTGLNNVLTVIVMPELIATLELVQGSLELSTQVTISPLLSVLLVKVGLLLPALIPFTFHWYDGLLPPLKGVAENPTAEPTHKGLLPNCCTMLREDGALELTVIVIPELIAVDGFAQLWLDKSTHVTVLELERVLLVNVGLLLPTLTPFTFH